ncbi:MAG: cation:H+ antiporter [Thermoproteota archaeon]|jgi:cation:H+ antiporter
MDYILLTLSFIFLYFGAEFSLDGAEKIGKKMGMSPLVIGMLLVGIGTSLPEFFVSHIASVQGSYDIALGGLIGSNIANIFLILGISALIVPLGLGSSEMKTQIKMHLIMVILMIPLLLQKEFNLIGTFVLFSFLTVYLVNIFRGMKKNKIENAEPVEAFNIPLTTFKMFVGFVLLYFGGDFLVTSGSNICKSFGVSQYVISSILVAFGTSFPELVTALIAALKKKDQDLIVGNIIGSNVFNIALIFGSLGFYKIPLKVDFKMELVILSFAALYMLFLSKRNVKLGKAGGVLFLAMYGKMVYYWTTTG